MSYTGRRSVPDWQGTVQSLEDTLEEVLDLIEEGRRLGERPDILALAALDSLNQYIEGLKRDLGV